MPVSDGFRSRREGKRGLRTFCGFARLLQGTGQSAREGGARPGFPWQGHESESRTLRCRRWSRWRPRPGTAWSPATTRMRRMRRPLAVRHRRRALGDGDGGHGDHADRDAVLRWPRRACSRRRLRAFRLRDGQLHPSTKDHTLGKPRRDFGMPRRCSPGTWTGRPDRSADMGLQDLQVGDRYLLFPDDLSPVVDDRPHRNVLTLHDLSADASASQPPYPGAGASGSPGGLVPMRKARHAGQTGSRLPLTAEDRRPQISGVVRVPRYARRHVTPAFLPDVPGRTGVPSP
jgi:hypothetical protein